MNQRCAREADLPELEWAACKEPLFDQPTLNGFYETAERILRGRDAADQLERPLTEGEQYLIAIAGLVKAVIMPDVADGLMLLPDNLLLETIILRLAFGDDGDR